MIYRTAQKITIATLLLSLTTLNAQELPMPSPYATVKQTVGLTNVEITYSRPSAKDREIFGALVPYNEMWRTGANKATAISFSTDVNLAGNEVKAGIYALFTVPGEKEWEIVINKNTEQWGTTAHKTEEDVVRFKVPSAQGEFRESMLFYFDHLTNESANLVLHWAKTMVTIPITVKVDEEAMKNIDKAVKGLNDGFRVYNSSARYYLENNKDVVKALEWAKKSVSMEKKYWNLTTLSQAQAANNLMKEAIASAEEAKTLATEAKADSYVKTNAENIAKWKAKK